MGIHYFPNQFVYWSKIKNHDIFKKRLLYEIENNRSEFFEHNLVSNGLSSFKRKCENRNNFNTYLISKHPDIIKELVWDNLDNLLKELNSRNGYKKISIDDSIINNSWISIYDNKSSVASHCHATYFNSCEATHLPSFVVVYILNDSSTHNVTEFVQPVGQVPSTSNHSEYRFNTRHIDEIHEGVVMIFPANLYHHVQTIESENRIVYTFNISSSFTD